MKKLLVVIGILFGAVAVAQDFTGDMVSEPERDPASVRVNVGRRTYPGGADEEDLQVQTRMPDAALKTDARSVQREVYKDLYKQDMKEERQETVEE